MDEAPKVPHLKPLGCSVSALAGASTGTSKHSFKVTPVVNGLATTPQNAPLRILGTK